MRNNFTAHIAVTRTTIYLYELQADDLDEAWVLASERLTSGYGVEDLDEVDCYTLEATVESVRQEPRE